MLTQRESLPTPCRAPRGKAGRQKISSPSNPLHFLPACLGFVAEKFFGGGAKKMEIGGGWV
ncbi:MAG: hypothetical protein D6830_03730 [Ignavibacteria bacterium]|nr:MAG: hypothetical protein D6830_03730 [Ignavibacteria bacterium]